MSPTQQQVIDELAEAAERLESAPPQEILRWAVERHRGRIALACSFGMQSVVVIDMLAQMDLLRDVEVFYLDTGVLFPETHQTRLKIQAKYKFRAKRVAAELNWEDQQKKFGGHLYDRGVEGVRQCCYIRKVEPTSKYLADKAAWITGMRRTHSKTRAQVPIVMWDNLHSLEKVNPVAAIDDNTLWGYIKANDVPYNALYDQGYPSIGCNTPVCTRPVKEGEDPRSGRWAGLGKTECGIHLDGQQIKSLDGSQL
ncbi:phosphoadenylyl-sulfate reductase [Planctomycetales bacterium ZRK34]|nr:phosphoadenylyl-sulfate reductase [Planctomycetales bacterium ZRK34]